MSSIGGGGGKVAQIASIQDGTVASGTTVIPVDDTIPQKTEGVEFLTLAITPKDVASTLEITAALHLGSSAAGYISTALFKDSDVNALAAAMDRLVTTGVQQPVTLHHTMIAGTTDEITFKIRGGCNAAGTVTLNGTPAQKYGGKMASTIIIKEIKP